MRNTWSIALSLTLLSAANCCDQAVTSVAETKSVHVTLHDGRQFQAFVDPRTDDSTLWLRVERESISLSMGVAWDLVASAEFAGIRVTGSELRESALTLVSPSKISSLKPALSITPLRSEPALSVRQVHVESLDIEAHVGNWDRDAEFDGIELVILPKGSGGQIVPLNGTVMVELIGRSQAPGTRGEGFPILGRWSQPVRAAQFSGYSGAVVRIPFAHVDPTRGLGIQPFATLQVRLQAVGQGHFEAVAPVRLRTFNPIRDAINEHGTHHDSFDRYRSRHW